MSTTIRSTPEISQRDRAEEEDEKEDLCADELEEHRKVDHRGDEEDVAVPEECEKRYCQRETDRCC